MGKVLVFDTQKDADNTLEAYRNKAHETLGEIEKRINALKSGERIPPTIGNGLEHALMVNLSVVGTEYSYSPEFYNHRLPSYSRTIDQLVKDMKKSLPLVAKTATVMGVTVPEVIYTIRKETPLISESELQNLKESLNSQEVKDGIKELPTSYQRQFNKFISAMLNPQVEMERGFTQEEIEEFEKLYF